MTDYIQELQEALKQAAARQYPALEPGHQNAAAHAHRRRLGRLDRRERVHRQLKVPRAQRPRAQRPRRTALRTAALACAVAAAAFVVANVASTGNGSAVQAAQAKTILRHIRAALVFPPHAIYEEESVDTVTARNGATHTEAFHEWLPTSPPRNGRIILSENGRIQWEQAFVNRRLNLYDPTTNTVYLAPGVAKHQTSDTPQSTSALSEVESLLTQPNVKINPNAILKGARAIELTFDRGRFSYWISPNTYQPLQSEDRHDALPDGQSGVGITRYPIVRVLTGASASPSLLSLQAQHPAAKVDASSADYEAAHQRLLGTPALFSGGRRGSRPGA